MHKGVDSMDRAKMAEVKRVVVKVGTSTTEPPRPPLPPSGPPQATYFSLRKLEAPSPPDPAST